MTEQRADRLREVGDRIEQLLEQGVPGSPVARDDARELVRIVVELYGSGLERVLEVADEAGALSDALLDRLADDDLVSSLLLVHGLHPYGVAERVERALAKLRPELSPHGGSDVELVEVTDEGEVRLRMLGGHDGCSSTSSLVVQAVRAAVEDAAPDAAGVVIVDAPSAPAAGTFIPVDSLLDRLHSTAAGASAEQGLGPTEREPVSA